MLCRFILTLLICSLLELNGEAFAASVACQGGYSPRFVIAGEVQNPTTYDEDSLAALPHSIENVTFLTKTGPQSGSFTGVLLWNLLNKAGIKSDPSRDGQFQYVEVTGTDCYQVVLALGELNPWVRRRTGSCRRRRQWCSARPGYRICAPYCAWG
jgi:hypothetical protein